MKLTTVISSVNNNPHYYKFIPYQIKYWARFGANFKVVFCGDKIPDELNPYTDHIILWNRDLQLNDIYVAQNIRMYYAGFCCADDEAVILTDMDLFPVNLDYYFRDLEKYNGDEFLVYYRGYETNQIYMCYNVAKPSTWRKLFKLTSLDDISGLLRKYYPSNYSGVPGREGWYQDQLILYNAWEVYPSKVILNRRPRRIEPWTLSQIIRDDSIEWKNFDDVHFHRDFIQYEQFVKKLDELMDKDQ